MIINIKDNEGSGIIDTSSGGGSPMEDRKRFSMRIAITSVFFIGVIVLAIILFIKGKPSSLPLTSTINITADLFCMVLGYVLFACCSIDPREDNRNLYCFLFLLFADVVAAFTDECAWLVDGKADLTFWNWTVNTVYYMTAPCMAFLFWCYVVSYPGIEHKYIKTAKVCLAAGLGLAIGMRLLNLLNGMYFTVTDGVYSRGPVYMLSNLYSYVTILLALVFIICVRKRLHKYQIVTLFTYAVFPLAVGVLTNVFYGLSISSAIIMMVLLFMYCVLNVVKNRERYLTSKELEMATTIQEMMLPSIFPPYPDRKEFDIYASMTPAREVGGDFYDFFLIDDDHLALVMADVSGKGVPAALFMMVAKSVLKNQIMSNPGDVAASMRKVNKEICDGNDLDMFVTVWAGVLTLSSGELRYCNAGHESAAHKTGDGGFKLLDEHHYLPMGAFENTPYRESKIFLNKNDKLFLYTDGVTEAEDRHQKRFGKELLIKALDKSMGSVKQIDVTVRDAISEFSDGADQFDDITMLTVEYRGASKHI